MAWPDAANIINNAAQELGLYSGSLTDPTASTDPNVFQLIRVIRGLGQDLVRDFPWSHLQKVHTFSTADGTAYYELPEDFGRLVEGTLFNRTQGRQLGSPLSAQSWQMLHASPSTGPLDKAYRFLGSKLHLYPTPSAVETVAFEYVSTWWVQEAGEEAPNDEGIQDGGDILWLDRRLLIAGGKLRFLQAKGFDTTAAQREYDLAYSRATGADSSSPVIRLGSRLGGLAGPNIPETGFGG